MHDDFLTEISISQFNEMRISKNNLRIDQPTIFMTIPDTNIQIWNVIYQLGLINSNCENITTPNKIFKINNKMFNGKTHYLDLKKNLLITKAQGKKFKIATRLQLDNITNKDKKFWIYDLSLYSDSLKYSLQKFSEIMAVKKFLNSLTIEYKKLKKLNPAVKIELLFLIKDLNGNLFNIFKNLRMYLPETKLQELEFYDNFVFVSNTNHVILPMLYKYKGKNKLSIKNINALEDYLEKDEIKNDINKESIIKDEPIEIKSKDDIEDVKPNKVKSLTNDLKNHIKFNIPKHTDDIKTNVIIDEKKLSTILRKHKINDPMVINNVKIALDKKIKEKGDKLTKDEAEVQVFKTIHNSLFNNDDIDPEFIKNPDKLFKKVEESRIHKTPLEFPKNISENIVNPNDIIDIKYTTGVWRQKDEFEKSIHKNVEKLFKTFEDSTDHPIKVLDIKHTIIDDDLNRIIRYEVTLKNENGGKKEPYKVYLNVPGIVNDRYLKLNDVPYIMPAQQFMKPVTKTLKDDVRLLTNYAIIMLKLENVKFTPTELLEIINYIQIKYSSIIKSFDENTGVLLLNNGSTINLFNNNEPIFVSENNIVKFDKYGKLIDKDNNIIKQGKNEFLYDLLIDQIQKVNPKDQLGRTTKSNPYISIYLGGFKIPFIIYLWQQKGLLSVLNDFGINYEISKTKTDNNKYSIQLSNGYLNINPENRKQILLCNGLLQLNLTNKIFENVDNPTEIHEIIDKNYGQRATFNIKEMNENMIDIITKELLQFENLPTNLNNLLSTHCLDKLLNAEVDNIADLKVYRARISEMILNIMYSVIKMSHTEYRKKLSFNDDDAKINIYSDFIMDNIHQFPGVLTYTEATNPVDEIILASKTIKTGPNGIRNKNTFRKNHRTIHKSHIGNMGANATSESGNVGLDTSHTLTPAIINEFGSYGKKEIDGLSGWDTLAINESLIPFINEIDSDRAVLAVTHSKQITPTNGNEPPLVGTGAEFIVTQLASKRFVQKAKFDGIVEEVIPNKYVTVRYKTGETEIFDLFPRLSKTKMNNFISLDLNSLNVGDKVSKNQLVVWSKNFNKNGMYCSGANVKLAVMQYDGRGHEDAYCVTEDFTNTMTRDIVREVSIVIPPEVKILKIHKDVNTNVTKEDVLVEFQYDLGLDNYITNFDVYDDIEDDDSDLSDSTMFQSGENSIKLMGKEGEVTDIKVYINNRNAVDKQLLLFHKDLINKTNDNIKKLESNYTDENDKIKAIDNISLKFTKIGNHKLKGGKEFTGGRIVYLIKQKLPLYKGDKIASRYGAKGVITDQIIPSNFIPKSKTHDLNIDVFISPSSIFGRKNVSMLKELYIGKIIYFLDKQIKEDSLNNKIDTDKIIKKITDVYNVLGGKESKEYIDNYFKSNTPNNFRKLLKTDHTFKLFFPIKPFKQVDFDSINECAKLLDIELDEYLYLPEFDIWTKQKVPVGIMYMQVLEQTSQIYASIRSTGKYQAGTGQASKGKSNEGGQAIGQLDVNALLTYDTPDVLDELMTLRSDEHNAKTTVVNNIINNGNSDMPEYIKKGDTQNLLDLYMTGMGLISI